MDPEVVAGVRRANESSIVLLTLMASNEDDATISLVWEDSAYAEPATCMALAVIALAAIRTLAQVLETTPQEIIQSAGITAAEIAVNLEKKED